MTRVMVTVEGEVQDTGRVHTGDGVVAPVATARVAREPAEEIEAAPPLVVVEAGPQRTTGPFLPLTDGKRGYRKG